MKIKFYFFLLFSIFTFFSIAQNNTNDVLFTVNDEPVLASEFVRVYNKNLDLVKDEKQKDVDNYLQLFIDFKLKLQEAKRLELDKKPEYLRELSNYRKQLAKNYLTDRVVTEELVKEAHDRISYEVNAGHVLVRMPEDASPQDTLNAYNEIVKLRQQVLDEGFETVKTKVHNGQTIFAEDLGYFGGFRMVYPFESAAFNTPVGELSQPFRTRFGYHVVKVFDKRKSKGEVEVAHILISKKDQKKDSLNSDPKVRINEIYQKLEQGENFENLAKQFSEDKNSANQGGKLSPFSSGQLSAKAFENEAFKLVNPGDYSNPVETEIGWHIIKLIKKNPVKSFEEMKGQLELKVKRDSRSQLISDSFLEKLKERYKIEENIDALNYFNSIVTDSFYKRKWEIPSDLNSNKLLNNIGDKHLTYGDFANYLKNAQRKLRGKKPLDIVIKQNYAEFIDSSLLNYHEENLEKENVEFANIVNEYRDGLLLFELMETEIWNAAKKDTLGVEEFYESNKDKYVLSERVDATIASSNQEKFAKKVSKMWSEGKSEEEIKKAINKRGKVNVIFTSGELKKENNSIPEEFDFKTGISKVYRHNDSFIVLNVNRILPEEQLSFKDAKGIVISDYQEQKEISWIQKLRDTYQVDLNQDVLNKIKSQINNN